MNSLSPSIGIYIYIYTPCTTLYSYSQYLSKVFVLWLSLRPKTLQEVFGLKESHEYKRVFVVCLDSCLQQMFQEISCEILTWMGLLGLLIHRGVEAPRKPCNSGQTPTRSATQPVISPATYL